MNVTPKWFRKLPVVIGAMEIGSLPPDLHAVTCWMTENHYPGLIGNALHPSTLRYPDQAPHDLSRPDHGWYIDPADGALMIRTLEGDMRASQGDWVIRGVQGEFYPCKPEIFAETYEEVPPELPKLPNPRRLLTQFALDMGDILYTHQGVIGEQMVRRAHAIARLLPQEGEDATSEALVALSQWIDAGNAHRDPEAITWGRLAKITEGAGEVIAAYIGATGQNPRKGVTHSPDDVIAELLDVAITALGAVEHLTNHDGSAMSRLDQAIALVAERVGLFNCSEDEL